MYKVVVTNSNCSPLFLSLYTCKPTSKSVGLVTSVMARIIIPFIDEGVWLVEHRKARKSHFKTMMRVAQAVMIFVAVSVASCELHVLHSDGKVDCDLTKCHYRVR